MVDSDFGLCAACWRETPFITGVVCEACGVPLPGLADGHRLECDACMAHPRAWHRGRAALRYEAVARKLVLALKHGDRQEIARPAGKWMAQAALPMIRSDMIVAPVPLHWSRLLRRRYNQSALLSAQVAKRLSLTHCPDLLTRVKRTQSLDRKPHDVRMEELTDAIQPHPRHRALIAGRPVLLIDDVMTSGATLTASTQACAQAGSDEICTVVLARVTKAD